MIDWNLLAKIAGGGFGVTIFVLVVISLIAWIMGLVLQKVAAGGKENSDKG